MTRWGLRARALDTAPEDEGAEELSGQARHTDQKIRALFGRCRRCAAKDGPLITRRDILRLQESGCLVRNEAES